MTTDPTDHEPNAACRESDDRLARSRRAAWAGTAVIGILAVAFFGLFAAFRRPFIGLAVDGVFLLPIALIVWIDHAAAVRRARRSSGESGASTQGGR
ncbi:MAG: hypothetical protein ACYC61_08600 [Isosphaeraceae bacterium]